MIEDHSPATVAVAHTRRPTVLLGEKGLGIAKEKDIVVLDAIDLAPGVHDPAVVACNGSNDVNALLLELLGLCNVRREMVCLAAWGEGAGNGEEDDLLVRPFLAGIVFLGTTADGRVAVGDGCPSARRKYNVSVNSKSFDGERSSIRLHLLELDALGELVANL